MAGLHTHIHTHATHTTLSSREKRNKGRVVFLPERRGVKGRVATATPSSREKRRKGRVVFLPERREVKGRVATATPSSRAKRRKRGVAAATLSSRDK